jgi:hypothetical protein
VQWKLEKLDPDGTEATLVKLALGKLKRTGRGVIYYEVKKIDPDENRQFYHVLTYDLPAAR